MNLMYAKYRLFLKNCLREKLRARAQERFTRNYAENNSTKFPPQEIR